MLKSERDNNPKKPLFTFFHNHTIIMENQEKAVVAATSDNLPAPNAVETLEFSQEGFNDLIAAIEHAEKQDVSKMEAVRVDATYLEMEKGKSIVLMVAGYSWRKSEFGEGEVLSVNFYDPKEKNFRYAMQAALVGRIREGKLPKGQLCKITYLGKKKGKKYSYDDYKVEVLIAK